MTQGSGFFNSQNPVQEKRPSVVEDDRDQRQTTIQGHIQLVDKEKFVDELASRGLPEFFKHDPCLLGHGKWRKVLGLKLLGVPIADE